MTSDKQNNGHLAKPFTPTLSAAFHRTSKSPLTPKLASPSPGPPVARRLAHPDQSYSTPSKDEIPAIPPTFLSANVTPRSGSRNTRRDGLLCSPSNTPPVPSPQTPYSQPTTGPGGPGYNGGRRTERSPARGVKPEQPRSLRAKILTAEGPQLSRPNSFSDVPSSSPMFFHASDAHSSHSSETDTSRPKPQAKMSPASSFIYADGNQEQQSPAEDSIATTAANRRSGGLPGGLPRPVAASRPVPSSSPRLKSPKLSDAASPHRSTHGCNPAPTLIPDWIGSRSAMARLQAHSLTNHTPRLHNTPDHPVWTRHTTVLRYGTVSMRALSFTFYGEGSMPVMSDQIPTLRPRIFSNGSSVSVSTDAPSSVPLSPGKSEGPGGDAAANARTERKILDLEISNSSLLAINRTLEREMRKQNAELRRYRRLSRSGRLSVAPSTRSFSGTALSVTSELDEGTSELSSTRSQDDLTEFSDEESVADESIMSPDSLAEHDAKHRVHDEKRFMLDLVRHQELLVDSQKMNQSLKRCLGWTEELIKEGQKALEYNVHVHDIELGGRVLAPEELGEIDESTQGLLSPSTECPPTFPSSEPASDAMEQAA
ncbi:hypothetical protein NUU61_005793 [Penicillium alfredii]|uniref:Uncharacterized protein n=1 Tax=Penicillium alfredii TaxID=1506179 RepID=A0A9W9K8Z8_9EURO|nr:uncharacterized protein NUU61_005793 [Penicillium alfredii]KAJ5096437.1 hypothetical protein NUU61_005793 [Penicillium alfredii]